MSLPPNSLLCCNKNNKNNNDYANTKLRAETTNGQIKNLHFRIRLKVNLILQCVSINSNINSYHLWCSKFMESRQHDKIITDVKRLFETFILNV